MIFINPIAKYSYNTSFQPLSKAQASPIVSAKVDSFELSNKQIAFKGAAGGINLHFPLQEVEELFARTNKEIRKTKDVDAKIRLIVKCMGQFNKIESSPNFNTTNVDENTGIFLTDRSDELFASVSEMLDFIDHSPKVEECGKVFKYTTSSIINTIKKYALFLEKGLDKSNMSTSEIFDMAVDSAIAKAGKIGITINVFGQDVLPHSAADLGMFNHKLYAVFSSMIQSAVKRSPANSKIDIKFERKRIKDANYFIYSISDNGLGIPRKERMPLYASNKTEDAKMLEIKPQESFLSRAIKILKLASVDNKLTITSRMHNAEKFPGAQATCYIKLKDS